MIEVEYLLTTSASFLERMAEKLSEGYGEKVTVKNNGLVFPPGLAKGRFEFYDIDPDMSFTLLDCVFYEDIKFQRAPIMINYFHSLSFNLSTISFMVERHDGEVTHIGDSWERKILYSTSEKGLGWTAPKNVRIRMLVLYFTRSWLMKYYKIDALPMHMPHAQELMQDQALQFTLDLDLEILLMVQDILTMQAPEYMARLYYEGCAKALAAMVASRLIDKRDTESKLNYEEVTHLLDIEKALEEKLDQPLPALEDLAQQCHMSKSKFEKLFKAIFGKSITDFFHNIRMQKAAELLRQGWDTGKAANMVGYSNVGNFAKVFKSYYNTTPKSYQVKMKENSKIAK